MKINKKLLYLLLIVVLLIIGPYIYNTLNNKSDIESFKINAPSFKKNTEYGAGYRCIDSMDNISTDTSNYLNDRLKDSEIPSFCNKYPGVDVVINTGAKIITDIVNVNKSDIVPDLNTSNLKVKNLGDIVSGPKYEYSILFKLKIEESTNGIRNIIHHGTKENVAYPSINIKSNTTNLSMKVSINSVSEEDKFLPKMQEISLIDNLTNKWQLIAVLVYGKNVDVYLNGKKTGSTVLRDAIIWPKNKQNIYVCAPWSENTSGFKLADMSWYPYKLSSGYLGDIANFKPEKKNKQIKPGENTLINDDNSLTLLNKWTSYQGSELKVSVFNNIVFFDGIITNGQINGVMGQLKDFVIPNRNIELLVGGSNGYYLMKILTNGSVYIFDNIFIKGGVNTNSPTLGRFRENEKIYLSNVRYPLKGSSPFNIVNKSNDSKPFPTFTNMGNITFLSGVISDFGVSDNNQIVIPGNIKIRNDSILNIYSGVGVISKININSEINKLVNLNTTVTRDISLEGISFLSETYRFLRLNLREGFVNLTGNKNKGVFSSASVYKFGDLVALNGFVRRMNKPVKNIKYNPTELPVSYSNELTNNMGEVRPKLCAEESSKQGYKYFHIDPDKNCFAGNNYNTTKPSWNKLREILGNLPNVKTTLGRIIFTKDSIIVKNLPVNLTEKLGLNYQFISENYMDPSSNSNSVLETNDLDGSMELSSAKYNLDFFPWQKIIKISAEYKLIKLPKIINKKVLLNGLVGIMPDYIKSWDPKLKSNRQGFTYLSPNKITKQSKFLNIGENMNYNETMRTFEDYDVKETRYINLTNKIPTMLNGTYKIVILKEVIDKFNNTQVLINRNYQNIASFTVKDGKYVDKSLPSTFRVKESRELITVLPLKYRPITDKYFTTYSGTGWTIGNGRRPDAPDGQANIRITKGGSVLLLDRLNIGKFQNISLAGITYLKT